MLGSAPSLPRPSRCPLSRDASGPHSGPSQQVLQQPHFPDVAERLRGVMTLAQGHRAREWQSLCESRIQQSACDRPQTGVGAHTVNTPALECAAPRQRGRGCRPFLPLERGGMSGSVGRAWLLSTNALTSFPSSWSGPPAHAHSYRKPR